MWQLCCLKTEIIQASKECVDAVAEFNACLALPESSRALPRTTAKAPWSKLLGYIFTVVVWSTANGVIVIALQNNWHHKPACSRIDILQQWLDS